MRLSPRIGRWLSFSETVHFGSAIVQSVQGKLGLAAMPDRPLLEIEDISLRVETGELAVLTNVPPRWDGLSGQRVRLRGDDVSRWSADIQLEAGLFVTSGHPEAIPGIRTIDLLHRTLASSGNSELGAAKRHELIKRWCRTLNLAPGVIERPLDAGFSPADGLALELLQLALLRPSVAVLDLANAPAAEASRTIIENGLGQIRIDQPAIAFVVITNDQHLIDDLAPDHIHHPSGSTFAQAHRDETLL